MTLDNDICEDDSRICSPFVLGGFHLGQHPVNNENVYNDHDIYCSGKVGEYDIAWINYTNTNSFRTLFRWRNWRNFNRFMYSL